MRAFQVLMLVVAALATYEIAAIGPDVDRHDPSSTITYIVTGSDATTALAVVAAAAFGIGLAIHFVIARVKRRKQP